MLGWLLAFRVGVLFLFFERAVKYGLITICVAATVCIGLFGFLWLSDYWTFRRSGSHTVKCVAVYILWAGLSIYWTPAGITAVGNWGLIALDTMLIYVATQFIPGDIFGLGLAKGWVVGAAMLASLLPFVPRENDGTISYLAVLNSHDVGPTVAIAILLCMFLWRSSRKRSWVLVATLLFCAAVASADKTDLGCVIAAGGIFLLSTSSGRWVKTALVSLVVVLVSFSFLGDYISAYAGDTHALYTLTGRTAVWQAAVDLSLEHPLLGNGFLASSTLLPSFGLFQPLDAHNEWLQTWLTLGAVGVAVLVMIYLSFFRLVRSSRSLLLRTLGYSLLVYATLHSLTEAPLGLSLPIPILLTISNWITYSTRNGSGSLSDVQIATPT